MSSHRQHSLVLLVASSVLLLVGLGRTDLWTPDEPRLGQVAEEVLSLEQGPKGLVLLHLGGEPYTQKPPLYYWLAALTGAPLGAVTEGAARLPSALAGIATVLVTYALGRRLFPAPRAALLGGAILLTSFRFAHLARRAQLDVLLALFETTALLAFWRLDEQSRLEGREPERAQTGAIVVLHAMLGAAALTKGPVGWIPALVIVVYLAWEGRLSQLRRLAPPWAMLLSVAPVVAWISAATWLAPAGFFEEAVVANLLGRVVDAGSHLRPLYYYLYQVPLDFLPWTLLWPLAWAASRSDERASREAARPWRLLAAWVLVPLLLFSLASGKRGLYLLPAFPALALACGAGAAAWLARHGGTPVWARATLCGVAAVMAITGALAWGTGDVEWATYPGFAVSGASIAALGATGALGLGAAVVATRLGAAAPIGATIATVLALELVLFTVVYPGFDEEKSPRAVAALVAGLTRPDEAVGIFNEDGLAGGILYYGARPVAVLDDPGEVQRFFEGGGRYVVLELAKLPWIEPAGPFQVAATTRSGERELAIVRQSP